MKHTTDESFDADVLKSEIPVLVDFWAPWCGPCKMVAPLLETIEKLYEGKMQVVKVNTDDNQKIATQYSIRSIPTIALFKNGNKVDSLLGMMPLAKFREMIDKHIGG